MPKLHRFTFHGTAVALSGRVIRPEEAWLDIAGASALPVEGGISRASIPATTLAGVIGFQRAETYAQGELDEVPVLSGPRRRPPNDIHAHTGAEVRGLSVGGRIKMTAARVRAELTALCPLHTHQPSIGAMEGARFEGVAFGKHRLAIAIDRQFFRNHDTHDKLCAACVDAGHHGPPRAVLRAPRPRNQARDEYDGPLVATIVKSMRWVDRPYPRASIEGHSVVIPGFGRVHFGEMLVSGPTRRLTMLRFALDGDVVMDAACCEVEAGGTWVR
ncbi:MAG: hypothetical protein AB7N65_07015 [Vicinamibacterales bacterium]